MNPVTLEIPVSVLRECGAPIPVGCGDLDTIDVDLNYVPELNNEGIDGFYFEGTVDGTWTDDWDANTLPPEWREKARDKWKESR